MPSGVQVVVSMHIIHKTVRMYDIHVHQLQSLHAKYRICMLNQNVDLCQQTLPCYPDKARFHEPTKHADESTLVGRLEANDQKFGLHQG